ncbi:hypothetical protein ACFQGE_11985 [Halomicroarcula sp. GCM10025817]|uniref:hypothetical protein n=1 Tax=Haloarcula TaxID=2237 RepID=UPI0023E8569E|nr:hypothetical protein [Halomicroarcula sp. SYNS111]
MTIPKRDLERDGLVDDDGTPAGVHLTAERFDERAYVVRIYDDDIHELHECEAIQRVAAERVLVDNSE